LLMVAGGFYVLRSEWCQKWCQTTSATRPVPRGLIAPVTSLASLHGPLRSTPILVTPRGYTSGADGPSLSVEESLDLFA
jgi:hypothetical protein